MDPSPILVLEGVVKKYGSVLGVGPIDFAVEKGEFLTLLGPSGCGKTTTLHIIAGLLTPTAGRVTMAGRDITAVEPPRRDMGVVFQNYALFPHKTVFDNVAFGLRMRKVPKEEIRERVRRILDLVGLPRIEGRYPHQLSGGQSQRVAVARALVIEPTALLLDEPLSNLDAVLRKRMRYDLRQLQKQLGITTIFVTHDQAEAFEMSDRVVLLNNGKIEQVGSPEELYDTPTSRFVGEFIGDANFIEGRVVNSSDGSVQVQLPSGIEVSATVGRPDLRPGDAAYLMIRPECIDLLPQRPPNGEAIAARVRRRLFSGEIITFELEAADGTGFCCKKPSLPQFREISPGDSVWLVPGQYWALPKES